MDWNNAAGLRRLCRREREGDYFDPNEVLEPISSKSQIWWGMMRGIQAGPHRHQAA
jgi:hypothetical protein